MHFQRDADVLSAQDEYEYRVGDSRAEEDEDVRDGIATPGQEYDNEDSTPGQEYDEDEEQSRPTAHRSTTEPSPATLLQSYFALNPAKPLHRNRSPLSRSHLRSRSSGNLAPPAMIRAHSMPAVHSLARSYDMASPVASAGHSPQRSPARTKSPLSTDSVETGYFPPRSPHWFETASGPIESIQEDSELDLTPRHSAAYSPVLPSPPPITLISRSGSMRRRPVSPLYNGVSPAFGQAEQESPALAPTKFSETFPSAFQLHHYSSVSSFSSISSTPSSIRSRSPSISSLETIEDAPDAEYEAIEADRLRRLSLSEKGDQDSGDEGQRRRGFGFGRGRNSERKRWSVCGGERRADLDLETIWED